MKTDECLACDGERVLCGMCGEPVSRCECEVDEPKARDLVPCDACQEEAMAKRDDKSKKVVVVSDDSAAAAKLAEAVGGEAVESESEPVRPARDEDAVTVMRQRAALAEEERRMRKRAELVAAAVEAGLNEEPGTAWWPSLAPLNEVERKLARQEVHDRQTKGGSGGARR